MRSDFDSRRGLSARAATPGAGERLREPVEQARPPRLGGADGLLPAISVVVCSYRSRRRIDHALGSLHRQDLDEPWEVIVVDSGDDDAAGYVARAYPEVKVVR